MDSVIEFRGRKKPTASPGLAFAGANCPVSDIDAVISLLPGAPTEMLSAIIKGDCFVATLHDANECDDIWVSTVDGFVEAMRISGLTFPQLMRLRANFRRCVEETGSAPYLALLRPLAWALTQGKPGSAE